MVEMHAVSTKWHWKTDQIPERIVLQVYISYQAPIVHMIHIMNMS